MADVINLRRARKRKHKVAEATAAAQNRIDFGLPKSERERHALDASRAAASLDGHLRHASLDKRTIMPASSTDNDEA